MVIVVENGKKRFDDRLITLIKKQNNVAAISIIEKVQVSQLTDSEGATLLHYASLHDNPEIVQYLIDQKCQVNATNKHGNSPLMFAVKKRNLDTTKILLEANARVGASQKLFSENFLLYAANSRKPSDLEIIECILAKITSGCIDNDEIARKLVVHECPLPGVIFFKNPELTKLMLNWGCTVDDCLPISKLTALHLAVELSDLDNVKVLLDYDADVSATDSQDCTPLHRFQPGHDPDILRLLLNRGASLITKRIINISKPAFISRILSRGDSQTIRIMLPYIDLTKSYRNAIYPVHDLAQNNNVGVVELIQGKTFNANARDHVRWTPLDYAAHHNCLRMVRFLLENGADPNIIGVNKNSPFHCHVSRPSVEPEKARKVTEILLHHGADAQKLWKHFPIFEQDMEDTFMLMQPVLAHLAMIESFGETLSEHACNWIEVTQMYKDYFESCKLQIELMKNTVMYESVTLYSLLSEAEVKIVILSENQEFLTNYELVVWNNKYNLDTYYISTIRWHVYKTLKLAQAKNIISPIICEMMCLPATMAGIIGCNVVEYLDYEDFEKLLLI